jgi:hypothetical protein
MSYYNTFGVLVIIKTTGFDRILNRRMTPANILRTTNTLDISNPSPFYPHSIGLNFPGIKQSMRIIPIKIGRCPSYDT